MVERKPPQQPKGYTIKQFIDGTRFNIPPFQRRYDWTDKEVGQMWEDLITYVLTIKGKNPGKTHFFGNSIIWNNQGVHELIDGQQRTLSFVALIAAFRDFFKEKGLDDASRDARDLLWIRREGKSFIHSSNSLDEPKLQELVNPDFSCATLSAGLPRLHKAYCYFTRYLEEAYAEELNHFRGDITEANKALETWFFEIEAHAHVSAVTCDTIDDAYIMFKAHNSRGLDLNASDMVKVALMTWFKERGIDGDRFSTLWTNIDSRCNEKPQEIHYMLGDFFKSRTGEMISSAGLLHHWESMLKKIPKNATKGNNFYNELDRFSETWATYFYKIEGNDRHNDLVDMRVSNQLAPMIAAWKASSSYDLQKGFVKSLYDCIEFTHIHAKVAGMTDANALKKTYVRWAHLLWNTGDPRNAIDIIKREAETHKVATKETFKTNLRYRNDLNTQTSRFMLRTYEGLKSPGISPNKMNHVEHIVPKAYHSQPDWAHVSWDDHTTKLNNLGNLTLLLDKSNMSIGNKGWAIKEPELRKSDLKLNKEIVAKGHTQWGNKEINARCNEIASYLYDNLKI